MKKFFFARLKKYAEETISAFPNIFLRPYFVVVGNNTRRLLTDDSAEGRVMEQYAFEHEPLKYGLAMSALDTQAIWIKADGIRRAWRHGAPLENGFWHEVGHHVVPRASNWAQNPLPKHERENRAEIFSALCHVHTGGSPEDLVTFAGYSAGMGIIEAAEYYAADGILAAREIGRSTDLTAVPLDVLAYLADVIAETYCPKLPQIEKLKKLFNGKSVEELNKNLEKEKDDPFITTLTSRFDVRKRFPSPAEKLRAMR